MADDRSEVLQSAAYAALTPCGKQCLHLIEDEIERGDGAAMLPRSFFMVRGLSKASTSFGTKQCERLGFISVGTGVRGTNLLWLSDSWRTIDAVEAQRLSELAREPQPHRTFERREPKPAPKSKPKPMKAERLRFSQRRMPSLPSMPWQDHGR